MCGWPVVSVWPPTTLPSAWQTTQSKLVRAPPIVGCVNSGLPVASWLAPTWCEFIPKSGSTARRPGAPEASPWQLRQSPPAPLKSAL